VVDRILDAAERLIQHQRFSKITVLDLTTEAEVSISSMYKRFPSKEAVLHALFDRFIERISLTSDQAMVAVDQLGDSLDPGDLCRFGIAEYVRFCRANEQMMFTILSDTELADRRFEIDEVIASALSARIASLLGEVDPLRIELLMRVLAAAIPRAVGPPGHFAERMGLDDEQLSNMLGDLALSALRLG